ncbi:MAG: YlxR family protein [Clostridiales bacterium]|nr:YlxR family protein [Clostridiales bacterium]
MAGKKIPMRMCVGCREMRPKKELLRIVRTPEEEIRVDKTGKASGRGAYICPKAECLEKAQRIRALERALEHKVEADVFLRLKEEIEPGE